MTHGILQHCLAVRRVCAIEPSFVPDWRAFSAVYLRKSTLQQTMKKKTQPEFPSKAPSWRLEDRHAHPLQRTRVIKTCTKGV
jgi:hypothetical protein